MIRNSVLIVIIVMFISCDNSIIFEEYKSFENQNWNTDSNLFIFIETDVMDTIELILANKEGMWLGNGIGDVREFEFEYQNKKLFSKKGNYSFRFEQAMRYGVAEKIQVLNNIIAVGLSIEQLNE